MFFGTLSLIFVLILVYAKIDINGRIHQVLRHIRKEKRYIQTQINSHTQNKGSGLAVRRGQFSSILAIETITPDRIFTVLKPLMVLPPIHKLEAYMVNHIRTAIFESGSTNDSRKLARYGIAYGILSAPPAIIVAIILASTFHIGFFGISAIPIAVMFSGLIQLKNAKQQRKSAIGHELPIFIACASVMEKVGVSFYEFIERISRSKTTLFPLLKQDALLFKRNVQYMAMSHTTALRKVAETHPNNDFKELVNNYTAAYNTSGASTANTMIAATESAFRAMRHNIKSYMSEANGIAQMVLLLIAAIPILAIATTFIATGKDALSMSILVMIMLPLLIVILLISIDGKQPRSHNDVKTYRQPFMLAFIACLVIVLASMPAWAILGTTVIVWAGSNALLTRRQFSDMHKMDAVLPAFAQYVTDCRLEGMEIREAIAKHASRKRDGQKDVLSPVLHDISKQMIFGKSLADAAESTRTKSWLSRILFFVFSQVQESGGGDTHSLQTFTNFVKDYVESKREMIMSLRGSVIMGYIIPIIMVVMFLVTSQMTSGISDDIAELSSLPINFPSVEQVNSMSEQTSFLIVECSILIGVLVSKITYFTIKHSIHVAMMAALGTCLCVTLPFLQNIITVLF